MCLARVKMGPRGHPWSNQPPVPAEPRAPEHKPTSQWQQVAEGAFGETGCSSPHCGLPALTEESV